MGLYIKGMEMPPASDEFVEVMIYGDGKVIKTGKSWRCKEDGKCYYESLMPEEFFQAIEIPEPHGRLGDLDDIIKRAKKWIDHPDEYISQRNKDMIYSLEREDAIIPASEEGE